MNIKIKPALLCLFLIAAITWASGVWAQENSAKTPGKALRKPAVIKYNEQVPMGTHRVQDESGRSIIVYSTGGPSESARKLREETEQDREKSWRMLSNIIIDTRSHQDDIYSSESGTTNATGRTDSSQ